MKKITSQKPVIIIIVGSLLAIIANVSFFISIPKPPISEKTQTEPIPVADTSRDHEGDTFSIVAYDPITGEIGGAGCSCYSGHINFLNDIVRNGSGTLLGAIHTQAAYNSDNQAAARTRMLNGDTPQQIVNWLVTNDPGTGTIGTRQYGIVGIDGAGTIRTAGYTGASNGNYANHILGPNYSIQGNILDTSNGQDLLNDMETAFLNAQGSLANKLMAALQAAKRVGGDNRCTTTGQSGRAAFVKVLRPSDPANNPYINISVYPNLTFVEPIDVLQCNYDTAVNTPFCRETIDTFPYIMDFEIKSWEKEQTCNVRNAWIRSRFGTPSANTGPNAASQGTLYAFVEASDLGPDNFNTRSVIGSPCFEIPINLTTTFSFNYHMYGSNMGTLNVTANDGSGWVNLWNLSGNQGNSWNTTSIDLTQFAGSTVKLRFDATTGNGELSDMAIDNISITTQPDTIEPTIENIPNQTLPGNSNCQATIIDYTNLAVVNDNADPSPIISQSPIAGTVFTGSATITLTVTDGSGNSDSTTFDVVVEDNTDPTINAIADQSVSGGANCEGTVPDYTSLAVVADNCDLSPSVSQSPIAGSTFNGTVAVVITVTDGSGNSDSTTFDVVVEDITAPEILNMPSNIILSAIANCDAIAVWNEPTVIDNCEASPIVTSDNSSGDVFPLGTTIVTYIATDGINTSTASFTVTVVDDEGPIIECPANLEVDADSDNLFILPDFTIDSIVFDNCTANPVSTQNPEAGTVITGGSIIVIIVTAIDDAGNISSCTFELTVNEYLSISTFLNESDIIIFPNPAETTFNIQNNGFSALTNVDIFDLRGRLIKTVQINQAGNSTQIDVSRFDPGVYWITIHAYDSKVIKRLIIE